MNKFLTFPGKQPVYLGDIDFMQTAVGQAFSNLLKNITGRSDANGILHGVVISFLNNSATWTAGVVSLGGEILPVDAGTIGGITTGLYFDIVSTSSGSRTFGDGVSHDCWETRKATLTTTATDYPLASVPRITPPDQENATVYAFDDVPNLADRYAKLVYTGGTFLLMIRKVATSELSQTYFEGDVSNIPEGLLQKFSLANTPATVFATIKLYGLQQAIVQAEVAFSVSNSKLHVAVTTSEALAYNASSELSQVLPVF